MYIYNSMREMRFKKRGGGEGRFEYGTQLAFNLFYSATYASGLASTLRGKFFFFQ